MAEKKLVMYQEEDPNCPKFIISLVGNPCEETVYAVTDWIDNEGEIQTEAVELAVHVDDMIKMRDFLNRMISKIGPAGKYSDDGILLEAI